MNAAYRLIGWAAGAGAAGRRRRAAAFRPDAVRRVWVHKPDHLGDAVLARPALAALRAAFPDAAIALACHPPAAALFAADPLDVTPMPWDSPILGGTGRLGEYLRRARRWRPDLAVNLRHDVRDILLCASLGARWLATYDHRGVGALATHPGSPPRDDAPEASNHVRLLAETLGVAAAPVPPLRPTPAAGAAATAWAELPGAGPRIALHAAARTPAKLWPVAWWRRLIRMWRATGRPRLALLGAAADRPLNAQIVAGLDGVADWAGRFTLAETTAVIGAADLLVGVDSGPGHLARALGVKVVSLMSGANSTARWAPDLASALTQPVPCAPCRRTRCPVAGHPCLAGIAAERVFAAAQEALGA